MQCFKPEIITKKVLDIANYTNAESQDITPVTDFTKKFLKTETEPGNKRIMTKEGK